MTKRTFDERGSRLDSILSSISTINSSCSRKAQKVALDSVREDDVISRKNQFAIYKKRMEQINDDRVEICKECLSQLPSPAAGAYVLVCPNCGVEDSCLPSGDVEERRTFHSENGEDVDHRRTEHYNREYAQSMATLEENFKDHKHLSWAQTRLNHVHKICKVLKEIEGLEGMPHIDDGDILTVTGTTRLMVMEILERWDYYMPKNSDGNIKYAFGSHVFWTLTVLRQAFAERSGYQCPTQELANRWAMDWIHQRLEDESSTRFKTDEHLTNATMVGRDSGVSSTHGTNNEHKFRTLRIDPLPEAWGDRMKIILNMNRVFCASHWRNRNGFHEEVRRMHLPKVNGWANIHSTQTSHVPCNSRSIKVRLAAEVRWDNARSS